MKSSFFQCCSLYNDCNLAKGYQNKLDKFILSYILLKYGTGPELVP